MYLLKTASLSYKFNTLRIGLPQTYKIGRNWTEVISTGSVATMMLEILDNSFSHLKQAVSNLDKMAESTQLIFSIISWLKVFLVWVTDTDEGKEYKSEFYEKVTAAFEKPVEFFSNLTKYLTNGTDLKCLMETIRRLSAELGSDRHSQNEILYKITWNLLDHSWLKSNQAALLECFKSLLSFSDNKLETIENIFDDGIKPRDVKGTGFCGTGFSGTGTEGSRDFLS